MSHAGDSPVIVLIRDGCLNWKLAKFPRFALCLRRRRYHGRDVNAVICFDLIFQGPVPASLIRKRTVRPTS